MTIQPVEIIVLRATGDTVKTVVRIGWTRERVPVEGRPNTVLVYELGLKPDILLSASSRNLQAE